MSENLEKEAPVKVAVRQRPVCDDDWNNVVEYEPKSANVVIVNEVPYVFDHVLGPSICQEQLFEEIIKPLLEKVTKGFNCMVLAYGQTGTGKSYTMGLSEENDEKHTGIVRRCLNQLTKATDLYEIYVSFVEIYNEKVFDLLSVNPSEPIMSKGFKYNGGIFKQIFNLDDGNEILKKGVSKRHVRPTVMNSQSSRSHVIFTIKLCSKDNSKPTCAILSLVDLAGSEGVRRTGHSGVAMSEGVHINQGLLCIGKILKAMSEGQKVIPFRDSVLGSVLQDTLNPNSYLTLLACISAKRKDLSETLSTIRFAQRAKQLKLTPSLNNIITEINKNKTKTPYSIKKITQTTRPPNTPLKRSATENIISSKENHLVHTFYTPTKQKRLESNFNRTDIGLTPKEKEKAQQKLMPAPRSFHPQPLARSSTISSIASRESLFEQTMSSWTFNASSSTTFEAPTNEKPISYSPIVAKCMEKFEAALENKMKTFMESVISANITVGNSMLKTPAQTPAINQKHIHSELKNIREIMTENKEATLSNNEASLPNVNARGQLFTTSSPVFKVPEAPNLKSHTLLISNDSIDESIIERTVRPALRSTRIRSRNTSVLEDLNFTEVSHSNQTVRPIRRSTRLQELLAFDDNIIRHSNERTEDNKNLRRSTRRRSRSVPVTIDDKKDEQLKTKHNKHSTKKSSNAVYNSTIASYFNLNNEVKPSLAKHRTAILNLLNQGSMKELQVLPQVGQKTAYLLVTHRIQNGKFKNLKQVENLPIWRGKAWERFAQQKLKNKER